MDIIDELKTIYDDEIGNRAIAEITMLRSLIKQALESCDAPFEFGTDLYEQMVAATRSI